MIELEDLQGLIIEKKLVQIEDSTLYSDEAYQYLKNLVDLNRAIIFEKNTHRIYTLGQYYGGDELKENLLYFSKLLSISIDDKIINEIDASKNGDSIAFKAKDNISLNLSKKEDYTEIEIGYDLKNIVDKSLITINNNDYNLDVDKGKIKINKYEIPIITIDEVNLSYDDLDENNKKDIEIKINSSINIDDYELFNISIDNGTLIENNKNLIKINVIKDLNPTIIIDYDDGIKPGQKSFNIKWEEKCYYGILDQELNENNLIEQGQYNIKDNSINNIISINQPLNYYGYYMCPFGKYLPAFIDDATRIQGAWHEHALIIKNTIEYIIYITDNSGLGKVEWEIKNKK